MTKIINGVNDLETLNKEVARLFSKNSPIKANAVTLNSNKKALFQCPNYSNHEWEARISSVTSGTRCPYCANLKILKGFNDLKTVHSKLIKEFSSNNNFKMDEVLAGGKRKIKWTCDECQGEDEVIASYRSKFGCSYCNNVKLLIGFNDFQTRFPEKAKLWSSSNILKASEVFPFTNKKYYFKCLINEDHKEWLTTPNKISNGGGCPECALHNFTSSGERELSKFISSMGYEIINSDRVQLKPHEIDVYLPDLKIGVEFNGDYWHGEEFINKTKEISAYDYHYEKYSKALEKGILLIYVWEGDWASNRRQVEEDLVKLLKYGYVTPILQKFTL